MTNRRINVRGVIYRDHKILAVKHRKTNGTEADYWAIPGGGLDPLESLHDGVRRELLEETGIDAKVGKLLFVQQLSSGKNGFNVELELFFHIENPDDFHTIDLTKTSHGVSEIARIEFIDPKTEYILPTLFSSLNIHQYIETPMPAYIHDELPH